MYRRLGVVALSIDGGGQMHGHLIVTTRYHLEASEPGALDLKWPASERLAITLRVRIPHAFLWARVAASEQWHGEEWGTPLLTALTATVLLLLLPDSRAYFKAVRGPRRRRKIQAGEPECRL